MVVDIRRVFSRLSESVTRQPIKRCAWVCRAVSFSSRVPKCGAVVLVETMVAFVRCLIEATVAMNKGWHHVLLETFGVGLVRCVRMGYWGVREA